MRWTSQKARIWLWLRIWRGFPPPPPLKLKNLLPSKTTELQLPYCHPVLTHVLKKVFFLFPVYVLLLFFADKGYVICNFCTETTSLSCCYTFKQIFFVLFIGFIAPMFCCVSCFTLFLPHAILPILCDLHIEVEGSSFSFALFCTFCSCIEVIVVDFWSRVVRTCYKWIVHQLG